MSEESGEPTPSKLKLSSSKSQRDRAQSAPTPSAPADVNVSSAPKVETPAPQTPVASKPPTTLKATPPPLTKKPAPRTSSSAAKKVEAPARPTPTPPEKDDPLGSVLIVAALLFILAAAAGGIWFLLRGDKTDAPADADAPALKASPSNPIERAKATIATVPDRNLDKVLDPELATETSSEAAPEPSAPTTLKESVSQYLQDLHIGGVRTGARARIMLDGENYNINDTVDAATGLIFIGTRDQKLLFKDRNGTTYVKSF